MSKAFLAIASSFKSVDEGEEIGSEHEAPVALPLILHLHLLKAQGQAIKG